MSAEAVIDVSKLSKAYPLYARPSDMLKELIFGDVRHDVFWALRDLSFRVTAGQRVGIIGANGAGKSTLLQIIAGTLQPTTGTVTVNGSISALLSLVPVWNLEQSGIENIRFNLLLRGCSRSQVALLTDDIVDFAELGAFIRRPVKTYSSGMSARLSFAIATSISPEILIVDEVLGAGDGYFAGKAARRMRAMCERGKALLFVSHSTSAVQQMCDTAIWMQHGSIRLAGDVDYVLRQYELDYRRVEDETTRAHNKQAVEVVSLAGSPDELTTPEQLRFRIVPMGGGRFVGTHFVRAITIDGLEGAGPLSVPLEIGHEPESPAAAVIDTVDSEWGRMHERSGALSRALSRVNGRRPGGQFVLTLPRAATGVALGVNVDVESEPTDETLDLHVLDSANGEWKALERSALNAADRVSHYRFVGQLTIPALEAVEQRKRELSQDARPETEILDVAVFADGESVTAVRERSSFDLVVRVRFNHSVPLADVGVKITRSDGVYVFWQSSALAGKNLVEPSGVRAIRFHFHDHVFGAGEYSASAYVSNGWSYPENYPYSQVYSRTVGALTFRVAPELKDVDFGVVNVRVPVTTD